ncbi:MAG: superoxide dismutase [Candidatus Eisenbacteria bacterium]|uniref:Superoxide dismutase n=1 Tax=Eiseniibacteriota bacterium TaxID=2212470 RepID=A0A956SDT7_UNCEI|nr:superoxide dismutase [Candidatus Eisenbacteria bacterium]MCB9464034.1 superoxide dismutase [Candidatus Eisenbacteria bacterium]
MNTQPHRDLRPRKLRSIFALTVLAGLVASLVSTRAADAHCQIPCGIYGDDMRFQMLDEHITTLEKSMAQIEEIGASGSPNWNQLVRWVENKDTHADEIASIVTEYFLQQRIKPVEDQASPEFQKYVTELRYCHEILVHAMKAKQTTDHAHIEALRTLVHDLAHSYLGESK